MSGQGSARADEPGTVLLTLMLTLPDTSVTGKSALRPPARKSGEEANLAGAGKMNLRRGRTNTLQALRLVSISATFIAVESGQFAGRLPIDAGEGRVPRFPRK